MTTKLEAIPILPLRNAALISHLHWRLCKSVPLLSRGQVAVNLRSWWDPDVNSALTMPRAPDRHAFSHMIRKCFAFKATAELTSTMLMQCGEAEAQQVPGTLQMSLHFHSCAISPQSRSHPQGTGLRGLAQDLLRL